MIDAARKRVLKKRLTGGEKKYRLDPKRSNEVEKEMGEGDPKRTRMEGRIDGIDQKAARGRRRGRKKNYDAGNRLEPQRVPVRAHYVMQESAVDDNRKRE